MMPLYKILLILLCLINTSLLNAQENKSWLEGIDNFRWAIDLSAKGLYNTESHHISHLETIGLDLHKVFTYDNGGDLGTLVLQGYLTKLNNLESYPGFYKNDTDLKFICRICNFNFTLLEKGLLNIRIGHAEIPFGLEYNLDTNGSLRQYSNGRDLGNKLDWGMAVNGKFSWGGYELSFSRGSGVDWSNNTHSYLIAGRVEIADDFNSFLGFSVFHGYVKNPMKTSDYISRTRIGMDASTHITFLTLLAEVSIGKDDRTEKINSLLEVNIKNEIESLWGYLQFKDSSQRRQHHPWDSWRQTSLGLRYTPSNSWVVSTQWTHDINVFETKKRNSMIELQLRYRF